MSSNSLQLFLEVSLKLALPHISYNDSYSYTLIGKNCTDLLE
jgi:hypothetical protein